MDVAWIVLGVLLIFATLLDAFAAALNYREAGRFANRIVRASWLVMRTLTRRVSRRWRPLVLRQVTGVLLLTTILGWLAGIGLGLTFIRIGIGADWGVATIDGYLLVGVTIVGLVLLPLIITFLGNAFRVIRSLRRLSGHFFVPGSGVGEPIDALRPFFPDGRPCELDRRLQSLLDSLTDYADGLAQNRVAYYFQSGREQFSLPFSVHMTAGVIGALRWGLPGDSDLARAPYLARLATVFEAFRLRMLRTLRWRTGPVPDVVTADEFARTVRVFADLETDSETGTGTGVRAHDPLDPWVLRFLAVDRRMRELTRSPAAIVAEEAYQRYRDWLPFEVQSQRFLAAISRDLDYQPVYRGTATTPDDLPLDPQPAGRAPVDPTTGVGHVRGSWRRPVRGLGGWVRRRHLFLDPGYLRLASALRSLVAVILSIGVVLALSVALGIDAVSSAVLAALVALFAGGATRGWGSGVRRLVGLIAVLPVGIGVLIGALTPKTPLSLIISIAVLAAAAAWSGRFGTRIGGLGQLVFVTSYFTLLLSIDQRQLTTALLAAAVGLLVSWSTNLVPGPGVARRVADGLDALLERVAVCLDTMIDVVSTGRSDHRQVRLLRSEQAALRSTASFVTGALDEGGQPRAVAAVRRLQVRVLDVQLAVEHLITVLPDVSSYAIRVEQRAGLAAELVAVARLIAQLRRAGGVPKADPKAAGKAEPEPEAGAREAGSVSFEPPSEWPRAARQVHFATYALSVAVAQLHRAGQQHLAESAAPEPSAAPQPSAPQPARPEAPQPSAAATAAKQRDRSSAERQSVQAGVSTALALWLGSFVSTSHQLWAAMPAFQVLSGSDGETRIKGIQRIVATLVGAALAFGLALLTGHNPIVAFIVLGASVFLMSFFRVVSSPWTALAQTLLLATMYDVLGTLDVETTTTRIAETAIGAVVAVIVSAVVLPTRTRARVVSGMSRVLRAASALADAVLRPLGAGAPAASGPEIARLVGELNREMNRVQAAARPLRHNPGSLDRSGIEAQLTSLWALIYYERRAATDARHLSDDPVPPREWEHLRKATEENLTAAQSVLADRVPRRLHDVGELAVDPGDAAPREVRRLLTRIERANQATLGFVEAVKPGTVGRDPAE